MASFLRRHRKKAIALGALVATPFLLHGYVGCSTRLEPPAIDERRIEAKSEGGVTRAGPSWATKRGVRIAHLAGAPEEIGAAHATLLREPMIENERIMWDGFRTFVSNAVARTLLFDIGRYRYRHVEQGIPEARRREIAAQARAFVPDPFADHMPTYTRMIFLHSLYDIAIGFEHSPLLGCTGFGLGPETTKDGHALFARAFDFEAAEVFDREKAVLVIREQGKIPILSVAWPGLSGVLTGMNAEGVAVAVNGGRARDPKAVGIPVPIALREVLAVAHDTREAVELLKKQDVMISHLVFVGDAKGSFAVVERAPGEAAFVRESGVSGRLAVTNHFDGPLGKDPKDAHVRATTSSLARRARAEELVGSVAAGSATPASAIGLLRDHGCSGGESGSCPLGDRRAIDALIATHGVVFDLTARHAWVSEGPHLSGRFVKIDLGAIVKEEMGVVPPAELETIAPDVIMSDGRYEEGRKRAGGPLMGPGAMPVGGQP
ncbi:MAG: hypothetical protein JST00_17630 [Deltaproteobacteria bacterium]|nr:hypothetical protein [Deltaproteobacteria bacterium]